MDSHANVDWFLPGRHLLIFFFYGDKEKLPLTSGISDMNETLHAEKSDHLGYITMTVSDMSMEVELECTRDIYF